MLIQPMMLVLRYGCVTHLNEVHLTQVVSRTLHLTIDNIQTKYGDTVNVCKTKLL
jgi:hypothetical protein